MNIIHDMNTEQFEDSPVVFGGAINQNRRNLNVEIDRIRKKMEMGADFFFTQPVFTEKGVNLLRQIKEETGARILCGIMPFVSRRNAVFMKNEMTGIEVAKKLGVKHISHRLRILWTDITSHFRLTEYICWKKYYNYKIY